MKHTLQENMRRFRTRNLREQAEEVPILTWKKLERQGYERTPGSLPIPPDAQYRVDPAYAVTARMRSGGEMALMDRLRRNKKRLPQGKYAQIVIRKLDNGNLVLQYIELI